MENIKPKQEIKIEKVLITDLKASDYNPRSWTKDQFADLEESIKRYGVVDPILVNKSPNRYGIVIGGHFRLEVLKKLEYKEVPVCLYKLII